MTECELRAGLDGTFRKIIYSDGGTRFEDTHRPTSYSPDYDKLIRNRMGGNDCFEIRSEIAKKSAATRKAFGRTLGRPARQWVTGVQFND